jgi:sulfur carrier protein ThiS
VIESIHATFKGRALTGSSTVLRLLPPIAEETSLVSSTRGRSALDIDSQFYHRHCDQRGHGTEVGETFERAGLRSEDVVVEINGKPVTDGRDLQRAVSEASP